MRHDAVISEMERVAQFGVNAVIGRRDLIGRKGHGRRRQRHTVEFLGQFEHGRVAAGAHIGDDPRYGLPDFDRVFTLLRKEGVKRRGKSVVAARKHQGHVRVRREMSIQSVTLV